jgi:phage-related protein
MAKTDLPVLKPVKFMGSSKEDLSGFPDPVKQDIGHALFIAQESGRAPNVKTLQGFGGGSVVEIVEDHDGDAYRCVYTAKIKEAIYVLHAFQKKSKRGSETPRHEIDLVRARLRDALGGAAKR